MNSSEISEESESERIVKKDEKESKKGYILTLYIYYIICMLLNGSLFRVQTNFFTLLSDSDISDSSDEFDSRRGNHPGRWLTNHDAHCIFGREYENEQ